MNTSSNCSTNNAYARTFRWTFILTLWIVQCATLLTNQADAFQTLRPSKTPGHELRIFQSRPTLEDYPISDFQQRLLNRMNNSGSAKNIKSQNSISTTHAQSAFIREVRTLKDYKRVVIDENEGKLVVVWFYSPWCRSCKGVSKGFQALSREYQKDVKFVQVPVLSDNATLHQGLGIKSVPFVHLYHPISGLVEERRLTRKYLPGFHRLLKDYRHGECSLEQLRLGNDDRWSTNSPYEPAPKSIDNEQETLLDEEE